MNNIINKINSLLENKNDNKDDGTKSKLSKNIMKDLENQKVIEKEFDIKLNGTSPSPSPIPSRTPTPHKKIKNKKKIIRKRNKKEFSENDTNNNNATPEFISNQIILDILKVILLVIKTI